MLGLKLDIYINLSPPLQGPGNITEERAERISEPEGGEECRETLLSTSDTAVAAMNTQLWEPALDWAL